MDYCTKCGHEIPGDNFCGNCGQKVKPIQSELDDKDFYGKKQKNKDIKEVKVAIDKVNDEQHKNETSVTTKEKAIDTKKSVSARLLMIIIVALIIFLVSSVIVYCFNILLK